MKRFYYLGDSKDFPSYTQDKNRSLSLVSGFSLKDFLNKNKLMHFDLLILCGMTEIKTLNSWFELLSREPFLPPVVLLAGTADLGLRLQEEFPFLCSIIDKSIPVETLWSLLEEVAENRVNQEKEKLGTLSHSGTYGLIGNSTAMMVTRTKIKKYANHKLPVLILGESGTGKELIARAIHSEGHGVDTAFEAFQVSPVSEEFFESILFGVRKGAFTGSERRKGLMEQAKGGVLFIDEIGTLSPGNQISLLRVLEEKAMRPLGSDSLIKTDFRLVSATNESFPTLIDNGRFRRDLYHRISTLVIDVPPLRDRKEDIILLAESFLLKERVKKTITAHAIQKLEGHDWPGNVRELLNTIRRAFVESGSRLCIEARDIIIL